MSTARFRRPPPPRGPAALAVLAALAAAAGCAREGAAPGIGPVAAQPAPATEAPSAPPTAAPSTPAGSSAVPAAPASAPSPDAAAPTHGGASALAAVLAAAAAPAAPELTLEQMQRRSPSAALVETFNAACAEPARNAVRRAARRLEFTPVAAGGPPREGAGGAAAASPEGGEAWRGPEEVGGAVLVWDEAASTCELRAPGVDLLLVEAAFSRLPQALEEEGASVMRLPPPSTLAGGVRTRQMLLVQPGGLSRPERARVLRLGHHLGTRSAGVEAGGDTVTLSARAVSAPR